MSYTPARNPLLKHLSRPYPAETAHSMQDKSTVFIFGTEPQKVETYDLAGV